jgi:hypothetical protein
MTVAFVPFGADGAAAVSRADWSLSPLVASGPNAAAEPTASAAAARATATTVATAPREGEIVTPPRSRSAQKCLVLITSWANARERGEKKTENPERVTEIRGTSPRLQSWNDSDSYSPITFTPDGNLL